jgi:hypothetical protein
MKIKSLVNWAADLGVLALVNFTLEWGIPLAAALAIAGLFVGGCAGVVLATPAFSLAVCTLAFLRAAGRHGVNYLRLSLDGCIEHLTTSATCAVGDRLRRRIDAASWPQNAMYHALNVADILAESAVRDCGNLPPDVVGCDFTYSQWRPVADSGGAEILRSLGMRARRDGDTVFVEFDAEDVWGHGVS